MDPNPPGASVPASEAPVQTSHGKRRTAVAVVLLVIIVTAAALYFNSRTRADGSTQPSCDAYLQVGTAPRVTSTEEAAGVVAAYYQRRGYSLASEDLRAEQTQFGWSVTLNYSSQYVLDLMDLRSFEQEPCTAERKPPDCTGTRFHVTTGAYESALLVRYLLPCSVEPGAQPEAS
jgi:hypothetical protein